MVSVCLPSDALATPTVLLGYWTGVYLLRAAPPDLERGVAPLTLLRLRTCLSQRKAMPENAQTTTQLHSHASKVMLKILQARLQQYVNRKLPDVQAGFRKGRRTRDQIANIRWIIKKAREFQKNIYFFFIDYAKAFYCVNHNKLWKILKEMGISVHLTCLLRNLHAGQEATVRTGHRTTDWF